jgi:hypothetical protein
MRDRASPNNRAMDMLRSGRVLDSNFVDVGCFSHTLDHVGKHFETPTLTAFMKAFRGVISKSAVSRNAFKAVFGVCPRTHSCTRWWSSWEQVRQLLPFIQNFQLFLEEMKNLNNAAPENWKQMRVLCCHVKCHDFASRIY